MDIIEKLYQVKEELTEDQVQERKITDQLFFLVHGRADHNVPNSFLIRTTMDKVSVADFLRKTFDFDIKEVKCRPIFIGEGHTYEILLN